MKILIVLITLLLLSTVVEALPEWTQNSASVPPGSQYSPGRVYGFGVNWTDISGIATVILDWNGNNYTANKNGDIFYYNLTGLSAGTYSYRWFANNTAGESAYSDTFVYDIGKNSSASFVLTLNGTEGNRSYSRYWVASFMASLNIPGKTIILSSSYPGMNVYNDSSAVYYVGSLDVLGLFSLNAVWNGDENYTGASKTYFFDSQGPQYSNLVTSPLDQTTYEPGTKYYFNVSWADATLDEVRFESNFSGSKKNYTKSTNPKVYNDSNLFWVNISDLSAKDFVYTWYAKDSLNNWTATNQRIYRVFKGHALNLYSPFTEVPNGTTTVFNCYSLSNQIDIGDFKFYRNSTLINNTSSLSRSDISILSVGFYRYVCNTTGNQNYSSQSLKSNLTVLPPEVEVPEEKKEFKITSVSSPSITVGETGQGTFNLSSTLDETITEITVEIENFTGTYTLDGVPSALLKGGSTVVRINFDIPSGQETGTKNITLRVLGKSDGMTVIATSYMILTINGVAPPINIPPSYSSVVSEVLDDEAVISFSLYDDQELSGYIFSTNETGAWVNETWIPVEGAIVDVNFTRAVYPAIGLVAWKAYFNDSDNAWSVSNEYYVSAVGGEFDYTLLIIIVVSFAVLAAVLFIMNRKRGGHNEKRVVYVYAKEGGRA